ncbi:MAG TPA: SDR family NAD(P)-dependent oxidoreductase, partial [Rhizomicrobium sp.]|nr:SDR family NAD(P)-dependent oxidoreductase [Rhizomicrobium sp.]
MQRFSLAGKRAFVTGGSRGIGRAIAKNLARAGADVAFSYRERRDEAEKALADIESLGRRGLALPMDVADRASVEAAAKDAQAALGSLSILVNNAGINKPTDFDQVTDSDWDQILSTNLKGPFVCAQVFLPLLAKSGGGSIVHIGSVSGQYGGPR